MDNSLYQLSTNVMIDYDESIILDGRTYKVTRLYDDHQVIIMESRNPWDESLMSHIIRYVDIHSACMYNITKIIKLLLSFTVNIESSVKTKDNHGETALILACEYHNLDAAKILLSYDYILKKSINVSSTWNRTPLYISCINGSSNITKLLLCKGANIDDKSKALNHNIINEYTNNPSICSQWCIDLNINDHVKLFLLAVFISDDYFLIKSDRFQNEVKFFNIVSMLPMELQMIICNHVYNMNRINITSAEVNKTLLDYTFL